MEFLPEVGHAAMQHRATMVPGLSKLNYEQRLELMDLPSLSYRRMRDRRRHWSTVYKYMNGIYKVNNADILPRHRIAEPATRGNSLKLEKRDCKSRIRANFFGYTVSMCGTLCPMTYILPARWTVSNEDSLVCLAMSSTAKTGKKVNDHLYPEWSQLHPRWMNSLQ